MFEFHYLKRHWMIGTARTQAVRTTQFEPENEGKLVVISGELTAADPKISDTDLEIPFSGLLLDRKVWMYQWEMRRQRSWFWGDYYETYSAVWEPYRLSDIFFSGGYSNPPWNSALSQKSWTNESRLTLHGYDIARSLVSSLSPEPVSLSEIQVKPNYDELGLAAHVTSRELYFTSKVKHSGEFMIEVGDYKVKYSVVPDKQLVTIIGQQKGNEIVPWRGEFISIAKGSHTTEGILASQEGGWGKWVLSGLFVGSLAASMSYKL
jgi:hypothetical protein